MAFSVFFCWIPPQHTDSHPCTLSRWSPSGNLLGSCWVAWDLLVFENVDPISLDWWMLFLRKCRSKLSKDHNSVLRGAWKKKKESGGQQLGLNFSPSPKIMNIQVFLCLENRNHHPLQNRSGSISGPSGMNQPLKCR